MSLPDEGVVGELVVEDDVTLGVGVGSGALSVTMRVCLVTVTRLGFGIVRVAPESVMILEVMLSPSVEDSSAVPVSVSVETSVAVSVGVSLVVSSVGVVVVVDFSSSDDEVISMVDVVSSSSVSIVENMGRGVVSRRG